MERVAAGVRPISDRGCGSWGARRDPAPQTLRFACLRAETGCGAAVRGRAACCSGRTSAGRIATGRWGDPRRRLDSWIFPFISEDNSRVRRPRSVARILTCCRRLLAPTLSPDGIFPPLTVAEWTPAVQCVRSICLSHFHRQSS